MSVPSRGNAGYQLQASRIHRPDDAILIASQSTTDVICDVNEGIADWDQENIAEGTFGHQRECQLCGLIRRPSVDQTDAGWLEVIIVINGLIQTTRTSNSPTMLNAPTRIVTRDER